MSIARLCSLIVVLAVSGCGPAAEVEDPPVPVAPSDGATRASADGEAAASDGRGEATIGGFRLSVPEGWRRAELSDAQRGFVDARFEVPGTSPEVQITLSTIGGGVDANVSRWITQFTRPGGVEPKTEVVSVDDVPVTLVDLQGTYQGMGATAQPEWRMLGAAFDGQPRQFYIKLTGPDAAVAAIEEEFRGFVKSARRAGP
jgi:hypothetical protein